MGPSFLQRTKGLTEQPTQDQPECSEASVQTPDSLHIDLPHVDPQDVFIVIGTCLLGITTKHWQLLKSTCLTCEILTELALSCMDVVQRFAEGILDIVIPQVYSYMRTHGTNSPTDFHVTEDQIQAYMGDSVEQALTWCLKINVCFFSQTKMFSQLLQEHILRTVNSVLALFIQSPTLESRLPVIFVSGCVTSITDLKHLVNEMATMLMCAVYPQQKLEEFIKDKSSSTVNSEELDSPFLSSYSRNNLKKQVKKYLIHMVEVLRNSLKKTFKISSRSSRLVCIRVGTNTNILTVEDSESPGHKSPMDSYSGLNVLPGSVPETDKTESSSNSFPFINLTITRTTEDRSHPLDLMRQRETIINVVDELMQAFMRDLHAEETGSGQTVVLQLDAADKDKIRKVTNRIFDLIMRGQDYQIPLVPAGRRVSDTITYRRLRSGDITDQDIVAHTLYMKTEEVVTRCTVQILLWSQLILQKYDLPSPSLNVKETSAEPVVSVPSAGDDEESLESSSSSTSSSASNATFDVVPESPKPTQSNFQEKIVQAALVTAVVGEMLTVIGVRNRETLLELLVQVSERLEDLSPQLHQNFKACLRSPSYRNIFDRAIADLLLEYDSFEAMQEAVNSKDPIFVEVVTRALRNQLRTLDEPSVSGGNAAEETSCSFLKKFKRLCCKTFSKKANKTTPVISLTVDQNNSELQEHVSNEDEPPEEETQQCLCPLIHRTVSSIRKKCSTLRKKICNFTRAMCRPFITSSQRANKCPTGPVE